MSSDQRPVVLILHCPEIQCDYVLNLAFTEFCDSFVRAGYDVQKVNRIEDICNNAIVMMGNGLTHPDVDGLCRRLAHQAPRAQYVGWYWQRWKPAVEAARLRFLYIHENGLAPVEKMYEPQLREMMRQVPGKLRCPLLLRANDPPDRIGDYARNPVRDYIFMGPPYCPQLVPRADSKFTGIYYNTTDLTKYLTYDVRRFHYLTSHFALGFQCVENVLNGHVSQRIYEGLAYGCIVLTNSWPAHEQTDGIAVYVSSREEIESKMWYYLDRPDEMDRKREEGYAFVRRKGTNDYARKFLLAHIENSRDVDPKGAGV